MHIGGLLLVAGFIIFVILSLIVGIFNVIKDAIYPPKKVEPRIRQRKQYEVKQSRTAKFNEAIKAYGFSIDASNLYYMECSYLSEHDIEKAASRLCLIAARSGRKISLEQAERVITAQF